MAESAKLRRPKSDGRCIHCRQVLVKKTKDHVFPDSWYPRSTPAKVQRWTVPSCGDCNHKYGEMENEVFIPLALCVDPRKIAAAGLSEKALRALGTGATSNLGEDEKQRRRAVKERVFKGAKHYSPDVQPHVLPGMGPHPEAPANEQLQILISGEKLQKVLGKVVRGCEYWLANGRIVEPPCELTVHFVHDADVPDVVRTFAQFGPVYLGPGFRVRRAGAHDEPLAALYEAILSDTLKFYAVIVPIKTAG
jgi:hypothetical protein